MWSNNPSHILHNTLTQCTSCDNVNVSVSLPFLSHPSPPSLSLSPLDGLIDEQVNKHILLLQGFQSVRWSELVSFQSSHPYRQTSELAPVLHQLLEY